MTFFLVVYFYLTLSNQYLSHQTTLTEAKMVKALSLRYWEWWFGMSKERKAIYMEKEKQIFCEQTFAGLCRVTGAQTGILINRLC